MKPESAKFIEQANILLGRAEIMLTVNLNEDAARTAYLSCHHAALAYIFERTGNSSKSHKGAQIEFLRLTKIDSRADVELRRFLSNHTNSNRSQTISPVRTASYHLKKPLLPSLLQDASSIISVSSFKLVAPAANAR